MLQLQARSVDYDPRRGLRDTLHFDKVVRLQRVAGLDQIDDPIG
jgi:hypothetical protein